MYYLKKKTIVNSLLLSFPFFFLLLNQANGPIKYSNSFLSLEFFSFL